jgi:hypothetical protein
MPVFAYIGTHRDTGASDGNVDPAGIQMFGLWFARNQNVDVADPRAAAKLARNPYFIEMGSGALGDVADTRLVPLRELEAARARITELEAEVAALKAGPVALPVEAPDIGAALTLADMVAADALQPVPDIGTDLPPIAAATTRKPKRK